MTVIEKIKDIFKEDLKVIIPDSSIVKKGYRYQKIYEIFVGSREL